MVDPSEIALLKAIRILAFDSVKERDSEYVFRYVCRWYSKEFHTPLFEVEAIPFEDVLQHFFECKYEKMQDQDHEWEEEEAYLRETAAEAKAREASEDAKAIEDAEFEKFARAEAEISNAEFDKAKNLLEGADVAVGELGKIPEGIKMEFGDIEDLDSWDVLGPASKK